MFSWSSKNQERPLQKAEKELLEAELTATASEGEGKFDETDRESYFMCHTGRHEDSIHTQVFRKHFKILVQPCTERSKILFSFLLDHERFRMEPEFVLPGLYRSYVVNWDSKGAKHARIDSNSLFISNHQTVESCDSSNDSGDENPVIDDRKYFLNVEDEFHLVLIKLILGLSNTDLSVRFNLYQGTGSKRLTTWINYLHVRFGELKIWPDKNVITAEIPPNFKEEIPKHH